MIESDLRKVWRSAVVVSPRSSEYLILSAARLIFLSKLKSIVANAT